MTKHFRQERKNKMELRWLILCDENGVKTKPKLQYREDLEEGWQEWENVETVIEKDYEYTE